MIGAVDIGGTKVAVLVTDYGTVLAGRRAPTGIDSSYDDALANIIRMLCEVADCSAAEITGIGIGSTGPVDAMTGEYGDLDHLPKWRNRNLVRDLTSLTFIRFPRVEHTAEENAGSRGMYEALLRKPIVWMYFVTMIAYVGCEQGAGDWISKFLSQYRGFDSHTTGAAAVSWFWGLMTVGCTIGMLLLKVFQARKILVSSSLGALVCLSVGLFGSAWVSLFALPAIGFFTSVMWPNVISLALNSVHEFHGAFAGFLGTGIGIIGGVIPVIIGRIGDHAGLRTGMLFSYVTFGVVFSVGFWARPLVTNATIDITKSNHTRPYSL